MKIDFEQDLGWDLKSLVNIMDDIIEKEMQRIGVEYINSPLNSGIITIVNYEGNEGIFERAFDSMMDRIRFELDKFNSFSATIGVGREKESFAQVRQSIEEAIYT